MQLPIGAILIASSVLLGQEFEVASVRPSNDGDRKNGITLATAPGGRLTITNFDLQLLIQVAYGVERNQILGGPGWMSTERFTIVAKPSDSSASAKSSQSSTKLPPPKEELMMLQALLADRFQLKLHHETKEGTVYTLLAGKNPKLGPPKDPNDRPLVAFGFEVVDGMRMRYFQGYNATMSLLATRLSQSLERPVADETKLGGSFDFKFRYSEEDTTASLVYAVQHELGLKLEAGKGPMDVLVVDHAERPSVN